ncbi:hypothetical protein SDRG_04578 [Saprolegnia diclina VS20]|uniref:Reverse transcriptase domain-containing protein n=1 Tax=Saprolegnia diclina (strain VS20) TaxID=1156394 RepID=T0QJE2_SAPDV|nr:hypothetical protein SDRG_04578 [Saprolegnia diclina VS20]EQC38149.1 hypothetical protein SDRG_04578 [Saprolegnia diclina VS20]|eukprot:XP_008608476.1 hypothetical protein SDRG_04578 [Saprolegnia diclina VS20]
MKIFTSAAARGLVWLFCRRPTTLVAAGEARDDTVGQIFPGVAVGGVLQPDDTAEPLDQLITPEELHAAIKTLHNNRACGPDNMPAEILKAVADLDGPSSSALICLPKPNKPQGVCSSLRPIVLLNCIRKAVSVMEIRSVP